MRLRETLRRLFVPPWFHRAAGGHVTPEDHVRWHANARCVLPDVYDVGGYTRVGSVWLVPDDGYGSPLVQVGFDLPLDDDTPE